MIYTFVPFAPASHAMDLGWTYNEFMRMVPSEDDWACFLDHDAMFTTRDWFSQLSHIIAAHPNAGCLTAVTNRIGNPAQVHSYEWHLLHSRDDRVKAHFEILAEHHSQHDIREHRRIGALLQRTHYDDVTELDEHNLMSGVVILTKKAVWRQIPFASGFLGVDRAYHRRCLEQGYKVLLMNGVYVYHWYRGDGDLSHVERFFA